MIEAYEKHVMSTYVPDRVMVKGQGTRVWDADGQVYLDFGSGIAVTNTGHAHPVVAEAIANQARSLLHVSNLYYTENQAKLAQRLSMLSLKGKCFFCNSGAEANEGLIKLARLWGHAEGRSGIITMQGSFHGRTLAAVAATGQDKVKKGFEPLLPGFKHAVYNDLGSVESLVDDQTVAVLVEPVLGEGGVVPATEAFMKGLEELCRSRNLLLLCDEVQCGMGRTGEWFGYQGYGITPDAFSLAKALGSGFPIGAVVAGPRLADTFQPGHHASTFGGTPIACAAALATLDVIESENLVKRARSAGEAFKKRLEGLVGRFEHVVDVRGRGLMLGIVMDRPVKPLTDAMRDIGLLTLPTAENVIRLLPPLNAKDSEFDEAYDIIEECIAELHGISPEDADADSSSEEQSDLEH